MEWLKMLAVLCVIVLLAIIDHEPIGDINARLGYIQAKMKKVRLSPFLLKLVPQKDTIGSKYFEYQPKEKEVYLLTVILTFLNIFLAAGLNTALLLSFILAEADPFFFLAGMAGYSVLLGIVILILETILFFRK